MRVFIAIDIDEKNKAAIGDLQQQLQDKADVKKGDVKWVGRDAMHLTLKFLGEIEDAKAAEVCEITGNVAASHKSFELAVESVGHFGGKIAQVVWIGTGKGTDNLCEVQKDLEQQLESAGWPKEAREFTGHLTLCRVKNPRAGAKLAQLTKEYKDFKLGIVSADSITVYKSQLTPTGPIYTVLGDYKLS